MAFATSKPPTEFNAITSQPVVSSANAPPMTENNEINHVTYMPVLANTLISQPPVEAEAVTIQPLLNPTGEGDQEQRFSQFNPTMIQPLEKEKVEERHDTCEFCLPFLDCLEVLSDCDFCCLFECCCFCFKDGGCECGGADEVAGIDGGEVADCCGACFECCSD